MSKAIKNKLPEQSDERVTNVQGGELNSASKKKKSSKSDVEGEVQAEVLQVAAKVSKRQRAEDKLAVGLEAQAKIAKRDLSVEQAELEDDKSVSASDVSNVSAIVPTQEELKNF